MKAVLRMARISIIATCLSMPAAGVSAAEQNSSVTPQEQYSRWHDSAVAFAGTLDSLSVRYPGVKASDKAEALQLIAQSEQAARRQDFNQASQLARQAYELLRASIAQAVMHPGKVQP